MMQKKSITLYDFVDGKGDKQEGESQLSMAVFSPCRTWRYTLTRKWNGEKTIQFIGLNPSTADEINNDPTVTRCINYAKKWGYGRFIMTNIFAYRSTDPKGLKMFPDPVGPENDFWIGKIANDSDLIIGAWGNHGTYLNRSTKVLELLSRIDGVMDRFKVLGMTKIGEPKHPLYLKGDLVPIIHHSPSRRCVP